MEKTNANNARKTTRHFIDNDIIMISWQILQNPLGLSSIKTFNFADIMKIFTDNLGFVGKILGSANFERPGVQVQYFPSLHITRYVLSCL